MSYLSNCEMCTGIGSEGYAPLESIASGYNSSGSYGSSSGYSAASGSDYSSSLEYTVSASEVAQPKDMDFNPIKTNYKQKKYFESYLTNSKLTRSYGETPNFVLQNIETKFIGDVAEISEQIEDAFTKVTGESLPDDIIIHVCSKERLRQFHSEFGGLWSDGINGFAVNKKISGQKSEIFVAQGQLSNVIATLGHEIGHCISAPLDCVRDEEAKAFAFEFAWVKAINDNNIGGLRGCFNLLNPAKNNIHNIAFDFVHKLIQDGAEAVKICFKLISKELTVGGLE